MFPKIPFLRSLDKNYTLFMQLHKSKNTLLSSLSYVTCASKFQPEQTKKLSNSTNGYSHILFGMRRDSLMCRNCASIFRRKISTGNWKRTFSSSSGEKDQSVVKVQGKTSKDEIHDSSTLLETWFYEVSPYGSLTAQLPFNTVIRPLNPQDYPDMNKCIIELYYDAKDGGSDSKPKLPNAHQLAQIADLYTLSVSFDEDKANMNLRCDTIEGLVPPVSCYLHVPLKFDVSVQMEGNESITVENMEGNSINIETNKGNINLKKNKSGSVSVLSKSGDIVSKSTQLGNISMHCGYSGTITADKLQGSSVTCTTELGSLNLKSLYTDNATFKTVTGDVHLGHCHGQICVVGEKSNVHIESLDGDLDVGLQQGSVKVHLSRHNKVDIDLNTGDIGLSFPEGTKTDLNLSGQTINVAEGLSVHFDDTDAHYLKEGHIGEAGLAQVNARTMSGNINLSMLDWIQTTKLAFGNWEE